MVPVQCHDIQVVLQKVVVRAHLPAQGISIIVVGLLAEEIGLVVHEIEPATVPKDEVDKAP